MHSALVNTAHARREPVGAQQERQLSQHDGHREVLVDRRRRARRPARRHTWRVHTNALTGALALLLWRTAGTRASRVPRRTAATRCSRRRSPAALCASARSSAPPTARTAQQQRLEQHTARRTTTVRRRRERTSGSNMSDTSATRPNARQRQMRASTVGPRSIEQLSRDQLFVCVSRLLRAAVLIYACRAVGAIQFVCMHTAGSAVARTRCSRR